MCGRIQKIGSNIGGKNGATSHLIRGFWKNLIKVKLEMSILG